MAEDTKGQQTFYDQDDHTRDYGGGAGYARRAPALAADASARAAEQRQYRRQWAGLLPGGRALDEAHLYELIDEGNQTAPAIVLRKRLLARAALQYKEAVVLSERDWRAMHLHDQGKRPDGTSYAPEPVPVKAAIDGWGDL